MWPLSDPDQSPSLGVKPSNPLRLRTLGGLWIDGDSPSRAPFGPRPLALLAVVAAAGPQGVSRERLIGILWPEVGEERARHNLSQALYTLRRDTGHPLVTGTSHLRLDPSLTSDISELQEAARKGEVQAVGELYTGRFLDGFYLPGAPEFERWVEEERGRVHQLALRAIEQLAQREEEMERLAEAVRWWNQLAELDPLNARYAMGHMHALAATGDHPGALVRARTYRETVRWELDAEPEAAVLELEQALKAETPRAIPSPPAAGRLTPVAPPIEASQSPRDASGVLRRFWRIGLPAVLLGTIAVVIGVRGFRERAITDLPFLAVGDIKARGLADTTDSGPIVRDMLATALGSVEGLRVVANSRLIELITPGVDPSLPAIHEAARRAGATEVIEGELGAEDGGLVLSLRRVTLQHGVVRRGYIVRGTNRLSLVDSAAVAIASDLGRAPPIAPVSLIRTSSPVAYALYDEGLRAHYGYDAPAAYRLMNAAIDRDSNFVMATYYAWLLTRLLGADDSTIARYAARLELLAPDAIERERLLILASVGRYSAPVTDALATAETLTVRYPTDPEGQTLLGTLRLQNGDWGGAVTAFERAVTIDSLAGATSGPYCRVCEALKQMSETYLWWDSARAAERTARRLIAIRPTEAGPWTNLVEPLFRQGRGEEAEAAANRALGRFGSDKWWDYLQHRDLLRRGEYGKADSILLVGLVSRDPVVRGDAWWLLLLSWRDQGRLREADTLLHQYRVPNTTRTIAAWGPQSIDEAMLGVEMGRPELTVRARREDIERVKASAQPAAVQARNIAWSLVLAGTAYAAAKDTGMVRQLADSLETLGPTTSFGRDARLHYFLRGLLYQGEGHHAEAVDAFRRSLFSLSDGYTRTNLLLARSLLALHRPLEAVAVLQPALRGGVDGSNSYVSRTELHEALALALDQAGLRDSAMVHWRSVEIAWRHADPQFQERYLRAVAAHANR